MGYYDGESVRFMRLMREFGEGVIVIEKVIFNDPATIILWSDGSKTVVKADGEAYDPEKGMAMAICKKILGNKGSYYDVFKKWLPKEEDETSLLSTILMYCMSDISKGCDAKRNLISDLTAEEVKNLSRKTGIREYRIKQYMNSKIKPREKTMDKIRKALGSEQLEFDI